MLLLSSFLLFFFRSVSVWNEYNEGCLVFFFVLLLFRWFISVCFLSHTTLFQDNIHMIFMIKSMVTCVRSKSSMRLSSTLYCHQYMKMRSEANEHTHKKMNNMLNIKVAFESEWVFDLFSRNECELLRAQCIDFIYTMQTIRTHNKNEICSIQQSRKSALSTKSSPNMKLLFETELRANTLVVITSTLI